MVWALKPYTMQRNLFERFALTGDGDAKTLGTSARTRVRVLAPSLAPGSASPDVPLTNFFCS